MLSMSSSCRISTIEIYKLMFLFDADTGNPFPCFGTRNDLITFVISYNQIESCFIYKLYISIFNRREACIKMFNDGNQACYTLHRQ